MNGSNDYNFFFFMFISIKWVHIENPLETKIIENTKHWGCKKEIVVYGSNSFYDSCLGKKKVVYSLIYFSRG